MIRKLICATLAIALSGCTLDGDRQTLTTLEPIEFDASASDDAMVTKLVGTVWKYRNLDTETNEEGAERHLLFFTETPDGYAAHLISTDGLVDPAYRSGIREDEDEAATKRNYASVVDLLAHDAAQSLFGTPTGVLSQFKFGKLNIVGFYSLAGSGQQMKFVTRMASEKLALEDQEAGDLASLWVTDLAPTMLVDTAPDKLATELQSNAGVLFADAIDGQETRWEATRLGFAAGLGDREAVLALIRSLN